MDVAYWMQRFRSQMFSSHLRVEFLRKGTPLATSMKLRRSVLKSQRLLNEVFVFWFKNRFFKIYQKKLALLIWGTCDVGYIWLDLTSLFTFLEIEGRGGETVSGTWHTLIILFFRMACRVYDPCHFFFFVAWLVGYMTQVFFAIFCSILCRGWNDPWPFPLLCLGDDPRLFPSVFPFFLFVACWSSPDPTYIYFCMMHDCLLYHRCFHQVSCFEFLFLSSSKRDFFSQLLCCHS